MIKQMIEINNPSGLYLRSAGLLCKEAMKYKCRVSFISEDAIVNVKSVLSVIGACVKCGDHIILECDGPDEQEALQALAGIICEGLGE